MLKLLLLLACILTTALVAAQTEVAQQAVLQTTLSNTRSDTPLHHDGDSFKNPYLEDLNPSTWKFLQARWFDMPWPEAPENHQKFWQAANLDLIQAPDTQVQTSWLGHSTVLIQYHGINILTDPVFSQRAFPVQFAGPQRYTQPAMRLEQLPSINYVIISHNHYDHLDLDTVKKLGNKPLWLVPLGLKSWFENEGISNVIELDWWQSFIKDDLIIEALPSQHWSRRSLLDTNKSLWASWAIKGKDKTLWFGGDTGYNKIQFKQIGQHLKKVDLAMIPIGAYEPRWFMKNQHVNPMDAIQIFQDIRAVNAFGIHWNTFVLTAEPVDEPPRLLQQGLKQLDIPLQDFRPMPIGETWGLP